MPPGIFGHREVSGHWREALWWICLGHLRSARFASIFSLWRHGKPVSLALRETVGAASNTISVTFPWHLCPELPSQLLPDQHLKSFTLQPPWGREERQEMPWVLFASGTVRHRKWKWQMRKWSCINAASMPVACFQYSGVWPFLGRSDMISQASTEAQNWSKLSPPCCCWLRLNFCNSNSLGGRSVVGRRGGPWNNTQLVWKFMH